MFPTEATARAWTQLSQAREHVELRPEASQALEAKTGGFNDQLQNFALIPDPVLRQATRQARVVTQEGEQQLESPLTPVDAAQIGLLWRLARRLMTLGAEGWINYQDFDQMISQPQNAGGSTGQNAQGGQAQAQPVNRGTVERKLKMSYYIDQGDDGEFAPPSRMAPSLHDLCFRPAPGAGRTYR